MSARQFIGAIALVRRDRSDGCDEWLALWNSGRACYQFIEAHKLESETFRQSLIREVAWATGLRVGKDFLVAGGPRAHLQFAEVVECGTEPVWFVVEFYLVELMGGRQHEILGSRDDVHWITPGNLSSGSTDDGHAICKQLIGLLKKADLFAPWIS